MASPPAQPSYFLLMPQDLRLCVFGFCTRRDIRENIVRVSRQLWDDCWHPGLPRSPIASIQISSFPELVRALTVLERGRDRYMCHLWFLFVDLATGFVGPTAAELRQPQHLMLGNLQLWFKGLRVSAGANCEQAGGLVVQSLCSSSLPSLAFIALFSCLLTSNMMLDITRGTPLVQSITLHRASVSFTGDEFRLWTKLKCLQLPYGTTVASASTDGKGLFCAIAGQLQTVYLAEESREQDCLIAFVASAPNLKRFTS